MTLSHEILKEEKSYIRFYTIKILFKNDRFPHLFKQLLYTQGTFTIQLFSVLYQRKHYKTTIFGLQGNTLWAEYYLKLIVDVSSVFKVVFKTEPVSKLEVLVHVQQQVQPEGNA